MDLEKINLKLTRYRINNFKLFIPPKYKTPYEVESSDISSIILEKNYDSQYIFPYFEVTINLPMKVIRALKKYSNDITVKLDLQYGNFKDTELSENKMPVFKSYVEDIFKVFISDTSPDINETLNKKIEEDDDTDSDGHRLGNTETIILLLYNKNYIENLNKVVNNILVSVSSVEAITYILNEAGIRNVLISPPDTYKKYSQFPLVPITSAEQISRICSKYGIHDKGTLIFFDINRGYIISKVKKCTAYESGEIKKTYLINTSGDNDDLKGCHKNTTKKFNIINVTSDCISFKDISSITDYFGGDSYVSVDKDGNIKNIDKNGKEVKSSTSSPKVLIQDKGENDIEKIAASAKESSNIMTLQFNYADLNMLTPNLQFITYFSDSNLKKYNGKYRITKMICQFSREGDFFVPNISAEFR